MNKIFQFALFLGIFIVAIVFFEQAQNGRYQYINNIILDTRSGEFWSPDGTQFQPREGRITYHKPAVDDERNEDSRRQAFRDCVWNHPDKTAECLKVMSLERKIEKAAMAAANPIVLPHTLNEQQFGSQSADHANADEKYEYKSTEVEVREPRGKTPDTVAKDH